MTNEKTEKVMYKTPAGEIFDVEGAFRRHPAITPGKANIDLWVKSERYNGIHFELRVNAETMARLVQILNAAPVNGDPLQAIVNLMDVVMFQHERDRLVRFLDENDHEPTLENIAAWYLEAGSKYALPVDVVLAGERKRYAVARVTSKYDRVTHGYTKELSHLSVRVPGELVTIAIDKDEINIEDLEGMHLSNGEYRILHALAPGDGAPLGGVILEHIKQGAN